MTELIRDSWVVHLLTRRFGCVSKQAELLLELIQALFYLFDVLWVRLVSNAFQVCLNELHRLLDLAREGSRKRKLGILLSETADFHSCLLDLLIVGLDGLPDFGN